MIQNSERITKLFVRFLKEFGVYKRFQSACKERDFLNYIQGRCVNATNACRLPSAFTWGVTPEGDTYWRTLLFMWGYCLFAANIMSKEDIYSSLVVYRNTDAIYNLTQFCKLHPHKKFKEYCSIIR